MTCDQTCMSCNLSQLYKVNYSTHHGLCKLHETFPPNILQCIHCKSNVPILILQEFKCILCEKSLEETEKQNLKSVCSNCLTMNETQFFALAQSRISNCNYCLKIPDNLMYSVNCKHFICEECLLKKNSCPLCVLKLLETPKTDKNLDYVGGYGNGEYKKAPLSGKKPKGSSPIKYRRNDWNQDLNGRKPYNVCTNIVYPDKSRFSPTDSEDPIKGFKIMEESWKSKHDRIPGSESKTEDESKIVSSDRDDNSVIISIKNEGKNQETSVYTCSKFDHTENDERRNEVISSTSRTRVVLKIICRACPCFNTK
ncbi:hypothetical protein SteCoe_14378 [Stentor coeruleus]|uniref:RING-type domain-containing protein n=1 Tax=Stentor coeruleus TaxID=5963 RepID=A0A1R2C403_9CILI|nr:hypothetical protein SteCoe_15318 [Stentor coeruleus]OMJ84492.1 hypothetical protein SteCoe_14378 [Stentor coeruleus]